MKERDERNLEKAVADLQAEFAAGYREGESQLAAGEAERLQEVDEIESFFTDRNPILDGEWNVYRASFRERGLAAALAARRTGTAILTGPEADFMRPRLIWTVVLNPRS